MTETTSAVERQKVPMDAAASLLADLCERIDNGEDPEGALLECFNDTRLALADAVDRRIAFDHWVKGAIEAARVARQEWDSQVQKLKVIHERFKAHTQATLEAHPDIPYQGRLGKIALQKSPPSVKTTFAERELTAQTIEMFAIEERFIRTETKHYLRADAIKAAIQAGETLPWAQLEQGQHVRFRK